MTLLKYALPALLLAACGSDEIRPTLRFADVDDAALERIFVMALGTEMGQQVGDLRVLVNAALSGGDCPTVSVDGDEVEVSGGCSTAEGALSGSVTATNPSSWGDLPWDAEQPSVYQFRDWTVEGERTSGRITYDASSRECDFTVERDEIAVRGKLEIVDTDSTSELEGGIELIGSGGALVSGSAGATPGRYTLEGADTLIIDFGVPCPMWWIEGTDREEMCP